MPRAPSPARASCSTTARAKVLVDCGMFQGSPNETIRNFVPLGMDPSTARRDPRHPRPPRPLRSPARRRPRRLQGSDLPHERHGRAGRDRAARQRPAAGGVREAPRPVRAAAPRRWRSRRTLRRQRSIRRRSTRRGAPRTEGHAPTSIDPATTAPFGSSRADPDELPTVDPETTLRAQPPAVDAVLDAPLYTEDDAKLVMPMFKPVRYGDAACQVAAGITATFRDAGHILGSAIIHLEVQEAEGGPTTTIVFSGDLGRPDTPILRDPTPDVRRGLRPVRVDVRRSRARAGGRGHPDARRGGPRHAATPAACC